MSDERSQQAGDEGDGLAAGGISTGGGPQRVVSEESVDDILESLDDSNPTPPDDPEPNDDEPNEAGTTAVADSSPDDSEPADESESASSSERDGSEPAATERDEPDSSQGPTIDPDELAARIENGDVTGADVRAAEAGEGRESTPGIDEIDLAMDDLESGGSSTGGTDAAAANGGVDDSSTTETDDDSPGLLARLKRLFSS